MSDRLRRALLATMYALAPAIGIAWFLLILIIVAALNGGHGL